MKQSLIRTLSRLVTFLCAIFLLAAYSPAGHGLYMARPGDLAAWARQGAFRFIRIDGGRIETMKAERTWWGKKFSEEEKETLTHVYDTGFDRMLGLLEEARFNWIWVTWSNGWSFEQEAENRENLAKVIERCHEKGIHVTAYMSAANMFWLETWKQDPETRRYGLFSLTQPMFYGGVNKDTLSISWQRRIADLDKPGWRAYLVKKAALAVDAGVDAIFYDNLIGSNDGIASLLSETQEMAEEKARESGKPKAMVYANVHMSPGRFALNDLCEVLWMEEGKDSPGVWDGQWQTENARKISFLYGEKQQWQPLKYEYDAYHCGHRERCIPGPEEQKLMIAETYAFGAALSRNIEGTFLDRLMRGKDDALQAWAAITEYNSFVEEHAEFYMGVEPVARIAVLSRTHKNPVADMFLQGSVQFETKVLDHLDKGEPLSKFKVLVVPFKTDRLGKDQQQALSSFADGGGSILQVDPSDFSGKSGSVAEAPWMRDWAWSTAGGPTVQIGNGQHVLARVTKKKGAPLFMVHLINYDLDPSAENVTVKIDLSGLADAAGGYDVQLVTPDKGTAMDDPLVTESGVIELQLSRLDRYAVAVIAALP